MRKATVERKTAETDVALTLNLDGQGLFEGSSGIGFFDHMLHLLARHGNLDLTLSCVGDLDVDGHHTVEDIALALGEALKQALGDKRGIDRYGDMILPMDETLVMCAVDLSGRPWLGFRVDFPAQKAGDFDVELTEEFLRGLAFAGGFNLHVRLLEGTNTHHIVEGIFKALGRSLRKAVRRSGEEQGIPSTKGML